MRTTLNLDAKLLEAVAELTGEKSKGKAVNKALEEYVRRQRVEEIIDMFGKVDMIDNLEELEELELKEYGTLYGDS